MRDVDDLDDVAVHANRVHDAEGPSPCDVQARQLPLQWLPDAVRVIEERTGEELAGTHRCGEATATTDMATLVAAFVAARLDGRGAEGCLTAAAKAHYSDKGCELSSLEATPGPIVLYGCGSHRIVSIPRDRVEVTKTGPTDVQLVIFVEGATGRELDEHLAIGPGRANGATSPAPQVILDVSPI